jgi:hypothetical protein
MTKTVEEIADICIGSYLLGKGRHPEFNNIFADKVLAWHNYDPAPMEFEGPVLGDYMMEMRARIDGLMPDCHVEDYKLHIANGAFVFVHTSCGTLPDGTSVRIPACSIFEVGDGKIVTVNSVSDRTHREPLEAALASA